MSFLYHDLYSIYLLFIISLISIAFIVNRKQIKTLLLIPVKDTESYGSLYFQRNINFSFLRFLYFTLIILISNSFIAFLHQNLQIHDFFSLLFPVTFFFITQHVGILIFGFVLNKYVKYKKVMIINIDIKAFISIYFFPILCIKGYTDLINNKLIYLISFIFLLFLILLKIMFLTKSNHFIGLKFIDFILYICLLEFVPIIALYLILT